ncbi:MAG: hypothetical protein ABDH63_04965 [Candidatus Caldarchaeales archaeon]
MRPATVLGIVMAVALLLNVFIGEARFAWTLLPVHIGFGVVAFGASVAYTVVSRGFRPGLALGLLLTVLTGVQGALGLAMVFGTHGQLIESFHRWNGNASFLIGLVGGILVGRLYRRKAASSGQ